MFDCTKSARGFDHLEFSDAGGNICSLQQSSAISAYGSGFENPGSSFIWLGVGEHRMHLSRDKASELAHRILEWCESGKLIYYKEAP